MIDERAHNGTNRDEKKSNSSQANLVTAEMRQVDFVQKMEPRASFMVEVDT